MNRGTNIKTQVQERSWLWLGLVALLWAVVAVSHQSFWLDEAHGAGWKATQSTLREWWQDDIAQPSSTDSQIAGYVFYIWGYAKVFGAGEWTLRAANLPWLFLGFWAWVTAFRPRSSAKWGIAAAAAFSPFLWYYLNEARPYAMQVGAGLLLAAALQRLYQSSAVARCAAVVPAGGPAGAGMATQPSAEPARERFWLAAFAFGLVLLSASNLLGEIWAAAAAAMALFVLGWKESLRLGRKHWLLCLTSLALLAGLGVFYLWTLKSGSRATSVGRTDLRNFGFVAYELLGFGGFGPGRLDIRGGGLSVFHPYLIGLAVYGVVLVAVAWAGLRQARAVVPARVLLVVALCCAAGAGVLSWEGLVAPFRILGRHFTPLVVPIIGLLGLGMARLWSSGSAPRRAGVLLFIGLSLGSCLSLRFAPRHAKDDYRAAAAIARAALQSGNAVWWNADQRAAGYYHLPTTNGTESPGAARWLMNPSAAALESAPRPDLVIASKPDVYDEQGAVAAYVLTTHFHLATNLMAFTIWQRAPASTNLARP